MSQTRRPQHPNAALTPAQRLKMVLLVVADGWSVSAVAQRFQVDDKTVRKWCGRYRAEGEAGLQDRSSRPRHSPSRTPEPQRRRVIELRRRCRRGAGFIAHVLAMNASSRSHNRRRPPLPVGHHPPRHRCSPVRRPAGRPDRVEQRRYHAARASGKPETTIARNDDPTHTILLT